MTIKIKDINELQSAANAVIEAIGKDRVVAFRGSMGAGKTTIIKAICDVLEVVDTVNSPTFAIVNEYSSEKVDTVFHFDFYRIEKNIDALNIGFDDYINSGHYCFIEWPEKIEELLPENTVNLFIDVADDGMRTITIKK